jgi:nucleoside-diphosphate-sugar epimerase
MQSALIRLTTATAAIAATATLLAQQPTFKTGTQIVPLYVTVTDADKRLVPDLTKARNMIGYQPKHGLDDILMQIIEHFQRK